MSTLFNIIREDFWAASAVFAVFLAALSYVFYLACAAIGGKQK